jgi:hypothetical protein
MIIAVIDRAWRTALILACWWLLSRFVKLLAHFRRRPANIIRLPLYIGITIYMAIVKIYALTTIREQRWLTRDVAVIDGEVRRTNAPPGIVAT